MQTEKVVLILSGNGINDAINVLCRQKEAAFHDTGKKTYFVDISQPDFVEKLQDALINYEIEFVFSYLGIGSELSWKLADSDQIVNLWEHHNIPFIKLQSDLPSYFIQRHGATPNTSINIYASPELAQVQTWYYQDQNIPYVINHPIIFDKQPIENVDFSQRKNGTLVFLKNGNDPDQLLAMWQKNLPPALSQDLFTLAQDLLPAALRCGPSNIFESIIGFVAAKMGNAKACKDIVRLYSAQLDDFFRRIKATMVAESLKKFPVKIIGKNWEHVNDKTAVAKFSNEINFAQHSKEIFANELGLIDMTPNYDLNVHDRFCRAVGNYSFILTNKTTWMQQNFPEFDDYTYIFDKDQFESKLEFLLNNKDLVVEQGRLLGTLGYKRMSSEAFVLPLIEAAEKVRFMRIQPKPQLQDFYVW